MSKTELILDYRETDLANYILCPFERRNIDLGDVQFLNDGTIELIIERKTVADLNSSIGDGRYSEQKKRLCSNFNRNRILYIIEGSIPERSRFIDSIKIYSSILHTMFRDCLHIYRTGNTRETAEIIMELWKRFQSKTAEWQEFLKGDKLEYALETDKKVYDKVSAKKSENNTPQVAFINMLGQIPGCSTKMAETIQLKYSCPAELIEAYNNCSTKKEQLLKDIQLENRKLGPVVSKRIYNYFFGITTES